MSQSHNPADSQALLQSMLQKLKLQSGREGQRYVIPGPTPAASTCGQDSNRGAANTQRVNSSPGNVFEFGTNGTPPKDRPLPAVDGNVGIKGGEIQQPGRGREVGRGLISFPSQKDKTDGNTGENSALVEATRPEITPTVTGQLFPQKPLKDADITSSPRPDGESVSFGGSAMIKNNPSHTDTVSSPGANPGASPGYAPRVFLWANKSTDANTGNQDNKVLHMGNGGFGINNDGQTVSSIQKTTNSSTRRSSENKTKRWTQRIKDRWKDRPGSSKKGKDEGTGEQKREQPPEALMAENFTNTPSNDGERTLTSLDSSRPAHTENRTNDGNVRPTSDFDLGLGSFSLLDEIVMGQEWAKFINPNLAATSTNQRPSEELLSQTKIPPIPHDGNQSSGNFNQFGGRSNQWRFGTTQSSPAPPFSTAQCVAFQPMGMDVTEGKLPYHQRETDQSEPMEDGHNQSDIQPKERGPGQQFRPPSFVDSANFSAPRSRGHLNRKRHHQPAVQMESDGGETDRERSMSSPKPTSSSAMDESGEPQRDAVIPLYNLNSPQSPQSPSSSSALRGVLKQSISQEEAMGTVSKRRRVEENRRVHFAEEIMTIASQDLDLDVAESDEDSAPEEDFSLTEQVCEVQPAVIEQVAPARRPALPAWILALKRKNNAKKHR
ncbi:uncharacterized protein zgc:113229 isoform X2 [Mugil cephalus]|uniref:uncharacterized protein zgc:113229 isoform X2 n=1 Tax=Mugil cephalus TaxID=48193 RepID=UPI001FB5D032|nr:uncharacterized protein zgc:113229 isoform X2 [Mugil cephalus]